MVRLFFIVVFIIIVVNNATFAKITPEQIWGLCIGIADYTPDALSLKWADKDAIDFSNFLTRDLKIPETHYRLLINREATEENILKHLYWLNSVAKPGDTVYIFYSGHSTPLSPFLPYDSKNPLSIGTLKQFLKQNNARAIVVFADTGYQGRLVDRQAHIIAELYGQVTGLSEEAINEMTKGKEGIVFITSSYNLQPTTEYEEVKNSLFTHSLLNTLTNRQRRADANNDRTLTLYELYQDLIQQAPYISDSRNAQQIVLLDGLPQASHMSMTTKVAIGAGIATAVGGGIALVGAGNDETDRLFTGIFKRERTGRAEAEDGSNVQQTYWTIVLNLTQNGTSISGSKSSTGVAPLCCTINVTVPVTGTVEGSTATISWPEEIGTCSTESCTYTATVRGGTYNFTLENNGKILRREDGEEYIRE